jgi:hypothetical protein
MQPRVVFGPARTNDEGARSEGVTVAAAGAGAASGASAGDTQGGQQGAVHFVAEAADPRSALRAARTYFLSAGALVKDIFAGEESTAPSLAHLSAGHTSHIMDLSLTPHACVTLLPPTLRHTDPDEREVSLLTHV